MKNLVSRHPVLFSLVAILIYDPCLTSILSALLGPRHTQLSGLLVAQAVLCLYVGFLLTRLAWWRAGGFTRPDSKRALLSYAPWLILPLLMLVDSSGEPVARTRVIGFAAFCLLVGFAEEGLLRGVVLRALVPGGVMRAALISSALFGAAHLTNMFQGRDAFSTVVQAIYATFIGMGFAGPRIFSGTIWPAVALHGLIDFSDFASRGFAPMAEAKPIQPGQAAVIIVITGLYALLGWWLIRRRVRRGALSLGGVACLLLVSALAVAIPSAPASAAQPETPDVTITQWQISQAFEVGRLDLRTVEYPRFYNIFYAGWENVTSEPSGLVNVSGLRTVDGQDADCVMVRALFSAEKRQRVRLSVGYGGEVALFLNRHKVLYGMSANRWPDPSFSGTTGLGSAVYLDMDRGLNEVFMLLKESSGGWGFACRADRKLDPPATDHGRLEKAWETEPLFLTPESVLYDAKRDVLYVTSFDQGYKADASQDDFTGYISKVRMNGEIESLRWVTGLHAPCGMGMYKDRLYTVERRNLVEIDAATGAVLNRYSLPGCVFPNDVAVDSKGVVYVTDTSPAGAETSRIYRFKDGKAEVWLETDALSQPNGVYLKGDTLLVGSPGDGHLKAIDVKTGSIVAVTSLGAGVIDGIRPARDGGYLVSHWEGRVFSVSRSGGVTELMDATGQFNTADFEYVADRGLLIIPTFVDNRVVAYRLSD